MRYHRSVRFLVERETEEAEEEQGRPVVAEEHYSLSNTSE